MEKGSNLIRVYTGTDITVNLLKEELEEAGISAMIQNDFNSGISAGFAGGTLSTIDLFIQESDLMKAQSIISEFIRVNEG